jgi:hypothetical protein
MVLRLSTNLLTEVSIPSTGSRAEIYRLNLSQSLAQAPAHLAHP